MNGFREKCEKPPFWAFWAKMANFGQFLAKMGKTNCNVSEKSNERFSSNSVTDARTYVRTDVNR